jgi:hypothetical protein
MLPSVTMRVRKLRGSRRPRIGSHDVLQMVLPVRIELTTSPLPREGANAHIYLDLLIFCRRSVRLGADLVLHAASPALIEGASWATLTWA